MTLKQQKRQEVKAMQDNELLDAHDEWGSKLFRIRLDLIEAQAMVEAIEVERTRRNKQAA